MSLSKIVSQVFAERDGTIDKPSFAGHELMFLEENYVVVIQPQYQKVTKERRPGRVTGLNERLIDANNFAVLAQVEGYFVGGMSRSNCTCGQEPIFVHNKEQSKEPGREHALLFDELDLPREAIRHSQRGKPVSSHGQYHLALAGTSLSIKLETEETPFFKNRRYEVWTVTNPNSATGYRASFEQVKDVKQGARFDTYDFGGKVFCVLSAPYVMLRPEQERKAAQKLILHTFK